MYDKNFKIIIFGDGGTPKQELVQRFLTNLYTTDSKMTIGVDFNVKSLIVDKQKVKLQIWVFGGEERFRCLIPTYVRRARGGIFVYDITNYSTLAHIDDWLKIIRKEIGVEDCFPILVVGGNAELSEYREVPAEDVIKIAKPRGLDGFIECSAKTGENVEEAFKALTRLILNCPQTRETGVRTAITDTNRYDVTHPARLDQYKPRELGATVPATPVSLRGAIMSELKQILNTRVSQKNENRTRDMKERREEIEKILSKILDNNRFHPPTSSTQKYLEQPNSTVKIGIDQAKQSILDDPEIKIKRILELEKEKKREQSFSRIIKRLQEATQLKDKMFMEQDLGEWLETLKGLKKGCEEILMFLRDKNQEYYHHISFEQWKYLLRVSSEMLEEFKANSSSFYKMSDDTKINLYILFEIFIPCREILGDGSFGKNVKVTFEEYLKMLKRKRNS